MSKSPSQARASVPPRRRTNSSSGRNAPPPRRPSNQRPSRGRPRWLVFGGLALAIALVVALVLIFTGGSSNAKAGGKAVAYSFQGTPVYGKIGPEGVPGQLGTPLAAANTGLNGTPIDGVQCNSTEQLVYHHHIHLAIFVNGAPRPFPLGVGMVPPAIVQQSAQGDFATGSQTCLYWLHVHAQDGILHIESPEPKTFELGQFFDVWGQRLSPSQVGPANGTVTATVNGKPWTGDPRNIPLEEHNQVVLNVGGPTVQPPPISWSGTGL